MPHQAKSTREVRMALTRRREGREKGVALWPKPSLGARLACAQHLTAVGKIGVGGHLDASETIPHLALGAKCLFSKYQHEL